MHTRTPRISSQHAGPWFDPWLVCAALLALIPIQSIIQPGTPHTADGRVHLLRALEATHLLQQGILYPRWAPDFYLGYGYPFFNFYAGGVHLLASWLALAGFGVAHAVGVVQVIALLLYPTGAYLAARSLLDGLSPSAGEGPAAQLAGLVSAALYLFAPLRWRELFVQGNLSQLMALAWLPWCAWLLTLTARHGGLGRMVASGAALAALLYLHHPSAFLAYPILGVYALILALGGTPQAGHSLKSAPVRSGWPYFWLIVGAFALALALGAPFWLPALAEMRYINLNAIDTGSFNAGLNLLPLSEVLALPAPQDAAALNPPMPNSLGVAQVVLVVPGLLAALWWVIRRGQAGTLDEAAGANTGDSRWAGLALLTLALLLAVCVSLMLPVAAPFWQALPLARLIAFPWRLLGPALLCAGILGGAWVYLLRGRVRLIAVAVALAIIPLGVATYLFPRPFAPLPEPQLADITRYELAGGARGTASANEYLPLWVTDANPPAVLTADYLAGREPARLDLGSLPAGSQVLSSQLTTLEDRYRLALPVAATVQIRRFYFPGWQAWIDGVPAAVNAGQPYGLILVAVPAGEHDLRLAFGSTPARSAALWLFGTGLMASALLAVWGRLRDGVRPTPAGLRSKMAWRPLLLLSGVVVVVAALKIGFVGPATNWFRYQSSTEQPADMQHPLHARFGNGVELIGYSLPATEVRQGGVLAVRLYWRPLLSGATNARPFLHLDAITGEVTWANVGKVNAGDKPMSAWVPGFYVVDDYLVRVPADTPAVIAVLRAGLLDEQGDLVSLAGGDDLAALATVYVHASQPLAASSLPGHDRAYDLGPNLRLAGYEAHASTGEATADLTLYWQALAPIPANYSVFVHVLDGRGQVVAQGDGPPVNGWYPTSAWLSGQIITDRRKVSLPPTRDAGQVRLAVGLYDLANGQRQPVTDASGQRQPNDQILISP